MKVPYTKSGKCGNLVYQRARYGQICYPAFVPLNPRTPAQVAGRRTFAAVSARWRTLTQAQRDVWNAVGRTKWSRSRLGKGRLPGYNVFVQINVPLANQGRPQVDLPPEYTRLVEQAAWRLFYISQSNQPPVGPTLFLRAARLRTGEEGPRRVTATLRPP